MTVEVDLVKLAVGLLVSGLVGAIGVVVALASIRDARRDRKEREELEREFREWRKRHCVDIPRRAGRAEMLHRFQEQADKDTRAGCDREAR